MTPFPSSSPKQDPVQLAFAAAAAACSSITELHDVKEDRLREWKTFTAAIAASIAKNVLDSVEVGRRWPEVIEQLITEFVATFYSSMAVLNAPGNAIKDRTSEINLMESVDRCWETLRQQLPDRLRMGLYTETPAGNA